MTEKTTISRGEFIDRYQDQLDKLFSINGNVSCVIRVHENWDTIEFYNMTLPGWSANAEIFQQFLDFISVATVPTELVFAEVESLERFTEVRVVPADREKVECLWIQSLLPHFNTICFDESAKWCAFFDNLQDKVSVCRAPA